MTQSDRTNWASGQLSTSKWNDSLLTLRWTVGYSQTIISHLSTEYVLIPISATKAGVAYNPTSDTVQCAFMPNAVQQPAGGDWVSGSWETNTANIIYPYNIKCLVGPTGVITLVQGVYTIYVKIVDNPETPVFAVGQLVVS